MADLTDITIPPEALEAARTAFANAGTADDAVDPIRTACLAMLEAWPGMERIYRSEDGKLFTIIFPLPQKETRA
ncbi:MAG: hypothetical protein K9G27_08970 [Sphingomonadaceae bacterium]|nr:hypothetical protein [Sphingomonadaceae bacterium]